MTTIKTIKLKRNPASAPAVTPLAPQTAEEPQTNAEAVPETLPAAPIGLEPAGAASRTQRSAFTLFAVFGICAMLALFTIIGLQAFEWSFYAANPSVWPMP